MFAYTYSQYGDPSVLQLTEHNKPTPEANDVLVKIYSTTVSSADWRVRSLSVPFGMKTMARLAFGVFKPRKAVLGTEFSGVVEAVGSDVKTFAPGDAVIGFPGSSLGAHAEYIVMPADGRLVAKPENLTFEQAAAVSFGGTTAYDYLFNKGKLQKGERVLINGASGSVGSACVEMAKFAGAEVTAVCSAANADLVRSIGADFVLDYTKEDITEISGDFDMVVDTVGTLPWERARKLLAKKGRVMIVSGNTSDLFFGSLKARLAGKRLIGGVASEAVPLLQKVVQMAGDGHFHPMIDRRYAFSQMRAAHAHVDSRRKKGNVVVTLVPEVSLPQQASS